MATYDDNHTYHDTDADAYEENYMGTGQDDPAASRADVFADPVRFLAGLGIEARVVGDTTLPAAA